MKQVRVVAGVIVRNGAIFATQRGYGEFKGKWEFPGGKIEPGETPQQALHRELREELDIDVNVGECLCIQEFDYPAFHLQLQCYRCEITSGEPTLKEHLAARWMPAASLHTLDWLPADHDVVRRLQRIL